MNKTLAQMTVNVNVGKDHLRSHEGSATGWLRRTTMCIVVASLGLIASVARSPAQTKPRRPAYRGQVEAAKELERIGKYDEALAIYRGLYARDKGNPIFYHGLKRILLTQKRYGDLVELLAEVTQRDKNPRYRGDLGSIYYRMGEVQRARQVWNEMIAARKKDHSTYRAVANAMLENRLVDDAIATYKLARRNLRNEGLFTIDVASLYLAQRNYEEATQEYCRYVKRNPRQVSYVERQITNYLVEPEAVASVLAILEAQRDQDPKNPVWHKIISGVYYKAGQFMPALEALTAYEQLNPKKPEKSRGADLYNFAEKVFREGVYDIAAEAYARVETLYPESGYVVRSKFGRARALEARGAIRESIDVYDDIYNKYKKTAYAQRALFQLGELQFLDTFEPGKALAYYERIVNEFKRSRTQLEAMIRIGDCHLALGDRKEAEEWYLRAVNRAGQTDGAAKDRALTHLARKYFYEGGFEKAQEHLAEVGENSDVYNPLVNDALELMLFIDENLGNEDALRGYARALELQWQRKPAEAAAKLQAVLEKNPKNAITDDVLLLLGRLHFEMQEYALALEQFTRLLDKFADSYLRDRALKAIGETYEIGLHDAARAQQAYEKVLVDYPQSILLEEVRKKIRQLESVN